MGDFSRNTFDPTKNYVAVRLQQGVPLVDADWNELNDVARHELYEAFNLTCTDGIQPGGPDLEVQPTNPETNDFHVEAGRAFVRGRIVHVRERLRYSTQPWTDAARATRDGVGVISALTKPQARRDDIVYLDVWEREIANDEDPALINPAIGVETCRRLKREAAVRVAEGTTTLPSAPAGHFFMPLTLLLRRAGQDVAAGQIADRRPFLHSPRGVRVTSFFPAFLPVASPEGIPRPPWKLSFAHDPMPAQLPKFHALKSSTEPAYGVLPLILPDGAFLTQLRIRGHLSNPDGQLQWQLLRIRHQYFDNVRDGFDILHENTLAEAGAFDTPSAISSDPAKLIVDNRRYYYALSAKADKEAAGHPVAYAASIHGVSIRYAY